MGFTTAFARIAAEYGVPDAIIGKMVQTEPGRMTWLTPTDLQRMNVVILTPSSPQVQPLPAAPPQTTPHYTPQNIRYVIQVGSKQSQQDVLATFADMQRKYSMLLDGYRPIVQKVDLGTKGIWYRMRIGPISDKATAANLCAQLMSRGLQDCRVMTYDTSKRLAPPSGRREGEETNSADTVCHTAAMRW
jgi:cell division septation protein DedD